MALHIRIKVFKLYLDYVCAFLPSPLDTVATIGVNPETEEEEERKASISEPTAALAFKIATDPFMGRFGFLPCLFW